MDDKKTIVTGSGGGDEVPTQYVASGGPPVVRPVIPGADQPTPRPGQPAWGGPVAADSAGTFGGTAAPASPESATVLMDRRAAPAVLAWLVITDGPERGHIFPLRPDNTTVGRVGGNDIVLPDDACSSQHLKIKYERGDKPDEGEFVLIDLASRNGTYVGSKTTYREPASRVYRHVLHDGDYLLLGETTLVFKRV